MPRNSNGIYELPAGNPVVSGTVIESVWANDTLEDVAEALTASLPRNGTAAMTGPLTLANSAPTTALHAASKGYVDKFIASSSGMPIGFISPYGGAGAPGGWLLCDGTAVSRTTYANLFSIIGTTYGAGDGVLTFNLPDLRGQFIRGRADPRAIGSVQAGSLASHAHSVTDPGHTHTVNLTETPHSHAVSLTTSLAGEVSGSVVSGFPGIGAFSDTSSGVFSTSNPVLLMDASGFDRPGFSTLAINA